MKNKTQVVIDTNVVVSAVLLPHSLSRQLFDLVIQQGTLLESEQTLIELNEVLARPKFNKYIPEQKRLEFFAALVQHIEIITISHCITICRDAKDNKFLELALSGNASHIVSGDNDLLILHPFDNIQILSPAHFLSAMRNM